MASDKERIVLVAGWIDVDPEDRQGYIEQSMERMEASQGEPGCVSYVLSPDPTKPYRIQVFEHWESVGHLDAHLAALRSKPRREGLIEATDRQIVIYEAAPIPSR